LQEQFGPDFQKKMQDQFGPEFQKKIQEKMQEQFGPDFQKKMQNQFGPEFQKKIQDEVQAAGKGGKVFTIADQDLDGLMGSLTPSQRERMKQQGYLTPSDLTPGQRKMLGNVGGKFEIKVKSDKGEMTIKSS
ncbi:MAG: hypothetical protein ACYC96_15470, partial [Fimbriimonadaceae bacterium]